MRFGLRLGDQLLGSNEISRFHLGDGPLAQERRFWAVAQRQGLLELRAGFREFFRQCQGQRVVLLRAGEAGAQRAGKRVDPNRLLEILLSHLVVLARHAKLAQRLDRLGVIGKTLEQNLDLIAKLDRLVNEFAAYPILVGTSRKSFIGRLLGGVPPSERLGGSIASALIAIQNGAKIVRVHDVNDTVAALKIWNAVPKTKTSH